MANEEKFPLKRYRQVTELRTQFQCEYRLLLRYKYGSQSSKWIHRGSELHTIAANRPVSRDVSFSYLKVMLVILTLLAGIFWIMG
ncbi:MAG: hypothetical protein ACFFF4_12010 [Candidatus Thorarchaeota archaeon]